MMEVEGISWREARKKLTTAAGAHLSRSIESMRELRARKKARRKSKAKRSIATASLPDEYLPACDEEKEVWRQIGYLKMRGIRLRTARLFRLGICLKGDYAGRIIFPVIENGEIKTFQARATGDWEPKYKNPDEVGKGNYIYGHDIVAGQDTAIVVEGPTDVIGCYQKGIPACALLGKTTTVAQIAKLRGLGAQKIVLMLDGSAVEDALKTYSIVSEIMPATVARLPGDLDPDEAPKSVLKSALREARAPTSRELRKVR
jgi:DNA primase